MIACFRKIGDTLYNLKVKYENLGYKAKKKIGFVISRIFLYFVLTELAFLFILPFIYIVSKSMMSSADYLDPTVQWIPTSIEWKNFSDAFKGLNFWTSFKNSMITSVGSAILQCISCAVAGYALGRFKFKGKTVLFLFVIITLLIPPQTTILSTYALWAEVGMINSYGSILLPCLFGLGMRGALFVLIYMYFFQRVPDAMDDAARIDGAGPFRVFFQIMLPLVKSATVIVAIFSFVWHWNDNYEAPMFLYKKEYMTLQPRLENIKSYYADLMGFSGDNVSEMEKAMTEPMLFAGCLLVMLPVLIVYIVGQKQLAAGIERIGVIE